MDYSESIQIVSNYAYTEKYYSLDLAQFTFSIIANMPEMLCGKDNLPHSFNFTDIMEEGTM